ncbi:uncharacterized protein YjaG (DUF416 family) [Rhizobium sp. BK591]|uniref:DUF416 family protein n=1 Tax=Rhizobium sp. BK591 TaxID=2586985 RepID=UPI00160B76AF|nr:DUF416 family protein [Rhizobium sp. BK591]MBB3743126.1 uncharacterized protein YjaG (DUF416 family) [Rhizobium sp. BK591]
MMEGFDEQQLLQRLGQLPSYELTVLATACASRQTGNVIWYCEEYGLDRYPLVSKCIEKLWEAPGENGHGGIWEEALESIMEMMPPDDHVWTVIDALAEDAFASLCYSVRTKLHATAQEATWALRRAYEAADQAAIHLSRKQAHELKEPEILAHPIVQRELVRQKRDYELILQGRVTDVIAAASREQLIQPDEREFF